MEPRLALTAIVGVSLAACGCGGDDAAAVEQPVELNLGEPPRQQRPAHVVGGFEAQLPEYVLAPGEEAFPCYIIPLEVDGPSRIVGGARLTAPPGLHHGNVTSRPKTEGEGIRSCSDEPEAEFGAEALDIVKGGAWLFASSTQLVGEEWQSFPDGHGYPVKEGMEIVAHMHYLNTTVDELSVAPRYEWFTIDEAEVVNLLAPFGFLYAGFEIPPNSTYTATGACKLPTPFSIVSLLPHMHALGSRFTAEHMGGADDGVRFLDSQGYDPERGVQLHYQPPVDLAGADGIRFSCTWRNTFDKTIVEGVGDNEMCMLFGYGYPHDQVHMGFAVSEDNCLVVQVPPYDEE